MGFFRGRKLSRISRFCGDSRKFSQRKSIFKQLDTALVGVVHGVTTNSRKFSPRKSIFKQFVKVFSLERNPLYGTVGDKENLPKWQVFFDSYCMYTTKLFHHKNGATVHGTYNSIIVSGLWVHNILRDSIYVSNSLQ